MHYPEIILFCILVPLIGSFILPFLGKINAGLRNIAALIFVLTSFVTAGFALQQALNGSPLHIELAMPLGLSFGFLADGLAVLMALISSLAAAIIIFYSFGYMEHYDNQNEYYMLVTLLTGAGMGMFFSTSLLILYCFWEIAAICGWRLIGLHRENDIAVKADKAFLINIGGSLLMLLGFIGIYIQNGTFNMLEMQDKGLDNWIMILILFGILSKSATVPLHSWLPDDSSAPAPVTALLNGAILVNTGVYVFARMFLVNFHLDAVWNLVIPIIAAISALVAAGAAMTENDIKRILSYSAVSQIGFIFLGLSCGNAAGAAGGLLYILTNCLALGGLFLCAGIIEYKCHTQDISQLGGLAQKLPITCIAFAMCAFSVMGIPPFGGFFARYLVIDGAFTAANPWIAAVFIIGSVMTVIYLSRAFIKVFFGQLTHPDIREGSWEMVSSVCLLGALSLLAGIFTNIPSQLTTFIIDNLGRW